MGVEKPSDALAEQLDLPKDRGLVIQHVAPGSAAAKGGIKVNDILVEVNGKPVPSDIQELVKILDAVKADEAVEVVVVRKGKKETLKGLTLSEAKRPTTFLYGLPGALIAVPIAGAVQVILAHLLEEQTEPANETQAEVSATAEPSRIERQQTAVGPVSGQPVADRP